MNKLLMLSLCLASLSGYSKCLINPVNDALDKSLAQIKIDMAERFNEMAIEAQPNLDTIEKERIAFSSKWFGEITPELSVKGTNYCRLDVKNKQIIQGQVFQKMEQRQQEREMEYSLLMDDFKSEFNRLYHQTGDISEIINGCHNKVMNMRVELRNYLSDLSNCYNK